MKNQLPTGSLLKKPNQAADNKLFDDVSDETTKPKPQKKESENLIKQKKMEDFFGKKNLNKKTEVASDNKANNNSDKNKSTKAFKDIFGVAPTNENSFSNNNENPQKLNPKKVSSSSKDVISNNPNSKNSKSITEFLNNNITPNNNQNKQPEKVEEEIDYEAKIQQTKGDFYSDLLLIRRNCGIMKSETIRDIAKASYDSCDLGKLGVLVLTDFRLYFKFHNESNEKLFNFSEDYFKIPIFHIYKAARVQDTVMSYEAYPIEIQINDTRAIKFHIYEKPFTYRFLNTLSNIISPVTPAQYYIFTKSYRKYWEKMDGEKFFKGWDIYDPIAEYKRQGITENNDLGLRFCFANEDYKLCPTYPSVLVFPEGISDQELQMASEYRTKNRLPVLSYYYNGNVELNRQTAKKKKGKIVVPSIWRSSQNKAGLTGSKRNDMDEKLMGIMMQFSTKLYIFDARPKINALVNRLNGGGYENTNNYNNTHLTFCDIGNIHAARNCLNELFRICISQKIMDNSKFWSSIEGTGWYSFIYKLLKYCNEISKTLQNNFTVLIHCSDGWDRSAQLISLSQMLIDPYFRTFKGLAVLIEKDWLSFGHQFGKRNGIYWKPEGEDQRSPIFLQWLDCLHQLMHQFPNAFEYNIELLVFLARYYTSNLYGTFMFNSDNERKSKKAKETTTSVWTDVYKNIDKYKNVYYRPDNPLKILEPNYAPYKLRFWSEFFMENNIYLENNTFYLSDLDQSIGFTSNRMFFEYHKKMDVLKYMNLEVKQEDLLRILYDVYLKTKDKPELLNKLDEKTREYLGNLLNKPKMKEILNEDQKKKDQNNINNMENIIEKPADLQKIKETGNTYKEEEKLTQLSDEL